MKNGGARLAFVPTMGALHEGHLSLLREGKKLGERLTLSIYVNPAQFAPTEDLSRYPRDLEGDLEKARYCGTDAVFFPSDEIMYPRLYQTYINVEDVTKNLCGASRPEHFRGVTTVVAKLFNIVEPDVAIFGQKDFQQLVAIKTMVHDLNMPVEIIGCPIVREADGLAMSSRNAYLSKEERCAALSINRSLALASKMVESGEIDAFKIMTAVRKTIEDSKIAKIDYAKLVDADTLTDLTTFKRPALVAIAAFFGKTRLIDNLLFK
jgi:pantoate--beta-alanine ligase